MVAKLGLPGDAQHHTWLGHWRNITDLILLGFMQCWFVELSDSPCRWGFINSNKWFYPVFFCSSLVYSLISEIPAIDSAVTEDSDYSLTFIIVLSALGILMLGYTLWHIMYAKRTLRSTKDFLAYLFSRVFALTILSVAYYMIHSEKTVNGNAKLHLHHYFISWIFSLIAI